jgi:hypothetical protein
MRTLVLTVLVSVFLFAAGQSQNPPPMHIPSTVEPGETTQAPTKEMEDMQRKMAQRRVSERYDSLKKDTDQLLQLATDLKTQVDKAGPQVLSLEVVKKTEEIEKLSKKIRDKMKTNDCPTLTDLPNCQP